MLGLLPSLAAAQGAPVSFAPLVRKVAPVVVNISVTDTQMGRHGRRRAEVEAAGSGFIVDPSGLIVTNEHVVEGAGRIVVSLPGGRELAARLVGADDLTDIAVIKVDPPAPLPAAVWGDSDKIAVGDWVLACGNPFGLGASVSAGIVSARGRDLGEGPFDDFLQLDAPINPGNSGGPSFDLAGEVVGVNTAIVSPTGGSVGVGFAIPSDLVRDVVRQLVAKGHIERGWLGLTVADEDAEDGGTRVMVVAVDRDGPAWVAGLRRGDQVLTLGTTAIDSARTLTRGVAAAAPHAAMTLQLKRRGVVRSVQVTVGRRPADDED